MIREADLYTGVRIVVPASVARARHPLRVDVNVGDPVTPAPVEVTYPALHCSHHVPLKLASRVVPLSHHRRFSQCQRESSVVEPPWTECTDVTHTSDASLL